MYGQILQISQVDVRLQKSLKHCCHMLTSHHVLQKLRLTVDAENSHMKIT